MSREAPLPFGRTETTVAEIKEVTDAEGAVSALQSLGCEGLDPEVERLLELTPALLAWLEDHGRRYPWRQTTDPWKVYISEILLQRTRGDIVESTYDDFFEQFPDSDALSSASEGEIKDQIESLGFGNQRTRTLQEAAELINEVHSGEVPPSEEELMRPWRVGPYSARACLIFAFNESLPLVDSNFARILRRVFGCDLPQQPHKSDRVHSVMRALVPDKPDLARGFNLAMLDLGALVCSPKSPDCDQCPLAGSCIYAREEASDGVG